ncbi:hypothetical protein KC354_g17948, partial [Hortaea werneckii]
MATSSSSSPKTCFVTIGATASFAALIRSALSSDTLSALSRQGYTDLVVQYGQDGKELFDAAMQQVKTAATSSHVNITGFDLDKAGLGKYMRQAKGSGSRGAGGQEGVVVSHAGSGTILDALRTAVPIIVVPNPDLLDNHQVELAEALAEQDYVVHGKLEQLPKALQDAEQLRQRQKGWPPVNAGVQREAKGLKGILDEEMGHMGSAGFYTCKAAIVTKYVLRTFSSPRSEYKVSALRVLKVCPLRYQAPLNLCNLPPGNHALLTASTPDFYLIPFITPALRKITNPIQSLNHQGLKLPEILHNRIPEMLVDLLKVPPLKQLRFASAAVVGAKIKAMTRNEDCQLLALPQEILDGITSYIQEGLDVICLALSHPYFFRLLADRVRGAVTADEAPWAGDRVIVVGDYATSVPSSVTAAETHHFVSTHEDDDPDFPPSADQRAFRARNPLYSMDKRTVSGAAVPVDLAKEWERIEALQAPRGWKRMRSEEVGVGVRRARVRRLNGGEMDLLDRLLLLLAPFPSPASPSSASASASAASPPASSSIIPNSKNIGGKGEGPPSSSSYILRNLTKRLFVRDSVLARSPRYRYSLGEVLCTRVLWTQDPSGTMGLGCRGKWAGDRFDIVKGEECGVVEDEEVEDEGRDEDEEFYDLSSSIYRRDEEEEDGRDETMPWKD